MEENPPGYQTGGGGSVPGTHPPQGSAEPNTYQPPNKPSPKLIVHNIPLDSNFHEIKDLCQEFGQVFVKVFPDQHANEASQFAIINFSDEVSSGNAMEKLNGLNLRGNQLSVRYGNAFRDDGRNRGRGGFERGRGRGGFGRGRGFEEGRGRGFGGVGGPRGVPSGSSPRFSPRHIRIYGLKGTYDWRILKDTLKQKCNTDIRYCQQTQDCVIVEFNAARDAERSSRDLNDGLLLFNERVSAVQGDQELDRTRDSRPQRSRSPVARSRSPDRRRNGTDRSRERGRDRSRTRSRSGRRRSPSRSRSRSRGRSDGRNRSPHGAPSREAFAQPRQPYMERLPQPTAPQNPENEIFYERIVIETADGKEKEIFRQVSAAQLGVAPAPPSVQPSRPVAHDDSDNRWGGTARSPSQREQSNSRGHRNGYERRGSSREYRDERRDRGYRR
eukprot:gb/GECG01007037.1/.p1 GENE.gb/GECG01007037.1/~~gb/GECG01007037.1/.p1  ORF type:complete len:442 (+),score=34.03 gb/GECG01007037.1/:1-1326(+)